MSATSSFRPVGFFFLGMDGIYCSFYEDLGKGSGCNPNVGWVIDGEEIYLGCIQDIDLTCILIDVSPMPLESVREI